MIAKMTRMLLCIQLLFIVILSIAFFTCFPSHSYLIALTASIAAVALFRMAITASGFALAWRLRSEIPPEYGLSWQDAVRLFLDEFNASMYSSSWSMPFVRLDTYISPKPAALPVLLIHGYLCNSSYWSKMSTALRQAEISHSAVDLEPVFAPIEGYAPQIRNQIDALCMATGREQIIIVAHSMGGLAARAYLQQFDDRRIVKVITLGTPHLGTVTARFSKGINCQQMRWSVPGHDDLSGTWLQQLGASENEQRRALFVSIYSHHDNIVTPQLSSHFPGAKNIALGGIGHVTMGSNQRICAMVIDEILACSHQEIH